MVTQEVEKKIMIGYLEMDLGNEILWACRMYNEVSKKIIRSFIHALELKLQPFEVFPYVCTEKPYVYNAFCPHST